MTDYRIEKCDDCPNIIERREADLKHREAVIRELATQAAQIAVLTKEVSYLRKDMQSVIIRLSLLAGGAGSVAGIIVTLITLHMSR